MVSYAALWDVLDSLGDSRLRCMDVLGQPKGASLKGLVRRVTYTS